MILKKRIAVVLIMVLTFCFIPGITVNAAESTLFKPAVNYVAGNLANGITVGDFNKDEELDLAVTNYGSDTVSVLTGKGDGTFNSNVDYNTGGSPFSVMTGDFNGDGRFVLAVANRGSNTVSILINDTILAQAASPTASPAGGAVAAGTAVTLSTVTQDAAIHYTTDGSTPIASSAAYTGPIIVNTGMTIKAIVVKPGMMGSSVMSETYTIASSGNNGGDSHSTVPTTSNTETVKGSVIDKATGNQVSNITAAVTSGSNGSVEVKMNAFQIAVFKLPDGTVSRINDASRLRIETSAGTAVTISSDGTIKIPNLSNGTDNDFNIYCNLGNGQKMIIGKMNIKVDSNGRVSLTCSLIDPYGIITDAATGDAITGADVTLCYADTDRNKAAGKTPDKMVELPVIDGFKPNNNRNPQLSDASGAYGFMVYPNTDYYIVAKKDGYEDYKSPTISVEKEVVRWDFNMNKSLTGVNRLSGLSRVDTAIEIAKAEYVGKVKNIVLATADDYPDALSGGVLAYKLNVPVLLIGNTDTDVQKVIDYMKSNMDSKGTVYILGGNGAISSAVESKIVSAGFSSITRLNGAERYETAVKIAESLNVKEGTPIVLVNGDNYPDALSISSEAAAIGMPILLVEKDGMSDIVKNEISKIKPSKIYAVGLQGAISDCVLNEAASIAGSAIVRIGGADRYETSIEVAKYFSLSGKSLCIATGNDFPDALAGSVYAANHNAPMILTGSSFSDCIVNYIKSMNITGATIFGGEGAVNKIIED